MTEIYTLVASIIVFFVGVLYLRKRIRNRLLRYVYATSFVLLIALSAFYIVADYFTGRGIDESVLYHLEYGLRGAGFGEYRLISLFALGFMVVGFAIAYVVSRNTGSEVRRQPQLRDWMVHAVLVAAFVFHPASADIGHLLVSRLVIQSQDRIDAEFSKYYELPKLSANDDAPNIVVIYAESLERTYFNEQEFPGLLKELKKLEKNAVSFRGITQVSNTGWTIGGMVASQCGVPLVTNSGGNSMSGMDRFLSKAVCLGDLLNEQGFHLSYMGGASLDFAGKGQFYSTHGFNTVLGREELIANIPDPEYVSGWGLYDDTLFDLAFNEYLSLSKSGDKFGLFLLTLDTHHPDGHISKSCRHVRYGEGDNRFLNAVACSDYLISKFIRRIQESEYGKNTIVVLMSDHYAMRNMVSRRLQRNGRSNLFMLFGTNKGGGEIIQKSGSMLDVGATLLNVMGFNVESLGLGRDLLGQRKTLVQEFKEHNRLLTQWHAELSGLWDYPVISDVVVVDTKTETMRIDDRVFRIPVLVEMAQDLSVKAMKFPFYDERGLDYYVSNRPADHSLVWFDRCDKVRLMGDALGAEGFCYYIVGERNNGHRSGKISDKNRFSVADIKELLGLNAASKDRGNGFDVRRIAHAGGAVGGRTYTNSIEALNENIKRGYAYFEVDFSATSDNGLVCIHDWTESFKSTFGYKLGRVPTSDEFDRLIAHAPFYKNCTLKSLSEWMRMNPSAIIVTDVKEDNIAALRIIRSALPDSSVRVIPQIYQPENFSVVKEMGYKSVIWTLYRYSGTDADVLEWVDRFSGNFAVTMPKTRAKTRLPQLLFEKNVPTYVHTVNKKKEMEFFMGSRRLSEIYTDYLPPAGS